MEMEIFSSKGHQKVPTATVDYVNTSLTMTHRLSAYAATLVPVSATNVSPNPPGLSSTSAAHTQFTFLPCLKKRTREPAPSYAPIRSLPRPINELPFMKLSIIHVCCSCRASALDCISFATRQSQTPTRLSLPPVTTYLPPLHPANVDRVARPGMADITQRTRITSQEQHAPRRAEHPAGLIGLI